MKERLYSVDEVRKLLDLERLRAGNLRALAAEWGMSHAYISDVINGKKEPRAAILSRLSLELVPQYRRTRPVEKKHAGTN